MNQKNALTATKAFEKWATGFSGCDGGNLDGDYWFCGIEWSGNYTEEELVDDFAKDYSMPGNWGKSEQEFNQILAAQYNRKILKLYSSIIGRDVEKYRHLLNEDEMPFSKTSKTLKLNLYPLAFNQDQDEGWRTQHWLYERTGLASKSLYRAWCQAHRFPIFRSAVEKHRPKVIVGTSRSYRDEYAMAFAGEGHTFIEATRQLRENEEVILDRKINWTMLDEGRTLLVVTPFLGGRWGLTSDEQLRQTGELIAKRMPKS